jgi:hypothetical protein
MKKMYLQVLMILLSVSVSNAQTFESFNFSGALNANGWTTHSGATPGQFQSLETPSDIGNSLYFTNLASSAGNRTTYVAGNSEDVNKAVTGVSGTGYLSFLLNVTNTAGLTTTGDYFTGFGATAGSSVTIFAPRVFIRAGITPNTFQLGVQNTTGGSPNQTYDPIEYPIGTTVFVVVKLNASVSPIQASLFVNPVPGSTEPAPTVLNTSGTSSFSNFASIYLRQAGNASIGTGNLQVDEIRVGSTWESVTPEATCNTAASITQIACDSYTVPSGDETYTVSGTYLDTIPNAAACDSVITINLTIHPSYDVTDAVTICDGSTYIFGTQSLTVAGVYTEVFQSVNSCDSTVELTLSTVTSFTTNISESICTGETYVLGAQNITTQGLYSETFISSLGCDSTVNLDLTVLPVFTSNTSEIGCGSYTSPSGNYTWTASGTYNDTIPSIQNGCDSVLVIDLTIADTSLIEYWAMACDQFIFEGNTYNQGGIYDVVYPNQFGCDSTLRLHLQITQTPSTPITSGDQELCDGDTPTDITIAPVSSMALIISGVLDGPLPGGLPKLVEFYAIENISDLSVYGFGSANNGGGTDGEEFTFPNISINAGEFYRVGTDSVEFNNFFGFYPNASDAKCRKH